MIFWNLLDDEPSRNGPLLEFFESMRCGTPGTNRRHSLIAYLTKSNSLINI
jgi:hypothetical protein